MNLGLDGKIALVTGASAGIGLAIAQRLAAEGCEVAICARDPARLQRAAQDIGAKAWAQAADLIQAKDAAELAQAVLARYGRLDILVNNAGGVTHMADFLDLDETDWEQAWQLNVMSAVRLCRLLVPGMRAQGWGRIINIASESGIQPDPFMPHYNACKAALINLGKSLSKAFAADGVLVNTVSPAAVRTPLLEGMLSEQARAHNLPLEQVIAEFLASTRPHIELKRLGEPAEIAVVVAFLASEQASFVNGANWRVDGGSVASL